MVTYDLARPLFRRSLLMRGVTPASCPVATPDKRRASTTLPKHRSSFEDFYSSATPRVQLLKHLSTREAPGDHPGSYTPSRISDDLRLRCRPTGSIAVGHVARGSDPQLTSVCIELPFDHSFRDFPGRGLSRFRGTELRSVPLPICRQLVAIRYRLRPD